MIRKKMSFYALPDENPLRVIIRGLPIEMDVEDIKIGLEELNLQVLNISSSDAPIPDPAPKIRSVEDNLRVKKSTG